MKMAPKKTFGDTTKLNDSTWSARARVEKLRESPESDYVPPKKSKIKAVGKK
jgi:hypothetical protein